MIEIGIQLLAFAIIIGGVVWFLLWRLFSKIGKGVNKELKKIKESMEDDKNE